MTSPSAHVRRATRRARHVWVALCCLIQVALGGQPEAQDLKLLSIEESMPIDVTSTARRCEPVGTAAAAVSVITSDDIRRSGVTTLADALTLLWGAVSRAVRRPTRFDDDIEVFGTGGVLLVAGSDDIESEVLTASELGYRARPHDTVSFDATLFVHRFADLRSQEAPLTGVLPVVLGNTLEGQSHGIELGVNMQLADWWRTHVGYTWLDTSIRRSPGSRDVSGGANEANDPNHLFGLRSAIDLPRDVEFDVLLRAVDDLPNPPVPAYAEMTVRLGGARRRAPTSGSPGTICCTAGIPSSAHPCRDASSSSAACAWARR